MHRSILAGLAMGALVAGLALAGAASAASVSDAWITTKLKASLVAAPDVSGIDVDVDTRDGRVTLHGMASNEAERTRAEAIALQVDGVREVRNLLQVVPEDRRAQVFADDRDLKMRVEQALSGDRSLEGIAVRSVNLGVVLLGGEAASLSDHLMALVVTRNVEGVRGVESGIESPDRLADAQIWREPDVAAEQDSVRSVARDLWITSAARVKLLAAGASALDVNVDTRGGVVTLFGAVDSQDEKIAVANAIQAIDGVWPYATTPGRAHRREPARRRRIQQEASGSAGGRISGRGLSRL
jgi:osmotically-inducible protein OsmY